MSIETTTHVEIEVHEGCGHNAPRKFDNLDEAVRYSEETSKQPHYLGRTTPVQLIVRDVVTTVFRFKNGEY
jgi:hypothetical protein